MFTDLKVIGLTSLVALTLMGCNNQNTETVEDMNQAPVADTFGGEIETRNGEMGQSYDTGTYTVQVNEIGLVEDPESVGPFQYQGVHVNVRIENNTDDDQAFDVWSQLRVGSVSNRDEFGALLLSLYDDEGYTLPELNDELLMEIPAGEDVTVDLLFDVIVPEEDNDVAVIHQIDPNNQYEDGYIVWDIEGFDALEPSDVEEIDWDAVEEEGESISEPEPDEGSEAVPAEGEE